MRGATELLALFLGGTALVATSATVACAQEAGRRGYDLPAQPLARSIQAIATATGQSIVAPSDLVEDRQAPALKGVFSVEEALDRLLAGSGLQVQRSGAAFVIRRDSCKGRTKVEDMNGGADESTPHHARSPAESR